MKRLIELLFSNILWEVIKVSFEQILKTTYDTISYAIWVSGFILINSYLVYFYFIKRKNRYFAFPVTGKILSFFHINNPDHFAEINIEALKAHLIGWNESYKSIIKKVILYRPSFESKIPTSAKYILYFDLKYNEETKSTRTIFKEFIDIDKKLPIIGDEFKNIYKKTVPSNHLDEWHLTVEKPEGVNEEFSYVLYP